MSLNTRTLRPGFLVVLKTSVRGNVSYRTLDMEDRTRGGVKVTRWNTERTTVDPVEQEEASKARSKIRTILSAACVKSDFGFLCPEDDEPQLERAIDEVTQIAQDFNRRAKVTRISAYIMTGRVAADDVKAVRAINNEIRELMEDMAEGVRNLEVKAIRDAANKAKSVGNMLTPTAQARVQLAIDAARTAARQIVKAGEQAAQEIDMRAVRKITEARTAFLDMDEAAEVKTPVAADVHTIDLDVAPVAVTSKARKAKAAQIEM